MTSHDTQPESGDTAMTDKQDTKQPERGPSARGFSGVPTGYRKEPEGYWPSDYAPEVWFDVDVKVGDRVRYWLDYRPDKRGRMDLEEGRVARVIERELRKDGSTLTSVVLEGEEKEDVTKLSLWPGKEPKAWGYRMPDRLEGLRDGQYGRGRITPDEVLVPALVGVGDIVRLWGHSHTLMEWIQDARVDKVLWQRTIANRIAMTCAQVTEYRGGVEA